MAIKDLTLIQMHLFICNGGSCKARGAEESTVQIRSLLSEKGISDKVHTTRTLCNGRCNDGPVVISQPDGIWFKEITADKCLVFVNSFIVNGETPQSLRLYQYGDAFVNAAEKVVKTPVKD